VFVELIEQLRCPRDHPYTPLVAAASRTEHRDILSGVLGCPECLAQFPIRDGVADMRSWRTGLSVSGPVADGARDAAAVSHGGFDPVRAAALLDLSSGGGLAVATGRWCGAAHAIADMIEGVHVLALNPVEPVESGGGVSVVLAPGTIPLRGASCRGLAFDAMPSNGPQAELLDLAVKVLRPRGRLLAPSFLSLPSGVRELAHDEQQWVAECIPAVPVVQLGRRS
jgi:uncharacterized protein YbaR (Trm112 family)